jgi:pyruvate,orthophosphate dikinase
MSVDKTWVYLFSDLDKVEKLPTIKEWDDVRSFLGGKGANLFEMTRLDLPVPPGFTVTTEACNAYLAHNHEFPPGMWDQEVAAMKAVEKAGGQELRRPQQPALRLLPLRRQVLHARHDGHRAQHRSERRDR